MGVDSVSNQEAGNASTGSPSVILTLANVVATRSLTDLQTSGGIIRSSRVEVAMSVSRAQSVGPGAANS